MKPWKKLLLIGVAAALILVCILCCIYIFQYYRGASLNRSLRELAVAVPAEPVPAETPEPDIPADAPEAEPETPTMEAVVDFAALQAVNDEIYAYL